MDAGPAGVVISLALSVAAMEVPQAHPPPDAAGTAAWLVSPIPGALDCLHRRLGHLGWRVSVFASVEHAMALMATRLKNIQEPPGLLIVEESNGTELPRMERIAAALPQVWPVLAVVTGSATVLLRGDTLVDIRCLPFSPRELERFTTHVDCRTSTVETRETSPTPLYAQDSGLVLVVDDDPINQAVVRGQLEVLGYDVVVAGDGAQALDACLRHPPDMVLMDVDMPVMDGLQATERVRAMQQAGMLPPFPIVAATGENSESRRKTCFCAGMDGYLSKPIDLRILAKEIHRVLPTRPVLTTGPGYA